MINVTEVKKSRGKKYTLTIEKNKKQEVLILPEDTLINHNILGPKELTEKEYKALKVSANEDTLYQKALYFITFKMRTISEVKKQLQKHTKDEALIDKLIQKLKSQGYLNDKQYTKEYITEKIEFDVIGPKFIKQKLIGKGIHFDLIEEFLVLYTEDKEYEKLVDLLTKETKHKIKKPYIKAYQNIKAKFINKGFSMSVVESVLLNHKDLLEDAVDEEYLLQNELKVLKKEYNLEDYKEKDKVIKKLLQKGYSYQKIKDSL